MVPIKASRSAQPRPQREPQYDAVDFAARYGVSNAAAREILRAAGPSREEAETAVLRMRQAAAQVEV